MKNPAFPFLLMIALWTSAVSAQGKIAVVRSADLVRESPIYKAAETKMKAEFEKRSKDLQEQERKLGEDIKKYQKEADTLSADARAKNEKDLGSRQIDIAAAKRKFQEDLTSRDRELTQDLMGKIKDVIQQVAKEKTLDLIVQDPVYFNPTMDITDEVLKRLSAKK